MLGLVPLKAWLALGAVIAIGALLWHDHHLSRLYKAEKANSAAITATLEQERANRKTEANDRKLADEIAQPVAVKVARIATRPDPVGVYCRAPKLPASASESRGTASPPDPAVNRSPEAPLRDIGSALGAARREAETNNAIHEGLIRFEVERTH